MNSINIKVGALKDGFNYRRRFNAAAMTSLEKDMRNVGLTTAITVRQLDDGTYQIVAGHRRVKVFTAIHGPDAEIPAFVRPLTDAEAMAVMVSENTEREPTTVIEDAEAASRLLGELNGNKEEAARRLGWNLSLITRRLALLNATIAVRDAYLDEKILLGHVEILAAMRREVQDKVLNLMMTSTMPTVDQLKTMAEATLLNLESAIFDKTDCGGCQYNTGNQQALFEMSFAGSRCTNSECYIKKTDQELEIRQKALQDTYQVVRIVRPGEKYTVQPLRAEGPKGVGQEQSKACRTCGDFGACVSATPDQLGKTFTDVCFNSQCNAEKVQAHAKTLQAADDLKQDQAQTKQEAQEPSASGAVTEKEKVEPTVEKPKVSSEPRNVVREYREQMWRAVLSRAALKLPVEQSRAMLIAICLFRSSTMDSLVAVKAIAKALQMEQFNTSDVFGLTRAILKLDVPQLGVALQQIPAHLSTHLDINSVVGFLKALDIKLVHHWMVNPTFFDLLTKTELDVVCVEIGIDKALGKEYAKLKNGSKADYVKGISAIAEFDYKGKIPALMRWK